MPGFAGLASVLSSLATGSYTVHRRASTTYVDGVAVEQVETEIPNVRAVVHPISGRELERLPEGLGDRELLVVLSPIELLAGADVEPDQITIRGTRYQIEKCEPWDMAGAWRAIAAKVG